MIFLMFLALLDDTVHMHTSICKQREREQGESKLPHIPDERYRISPTRQTTDKQATHQHGWRNKQKTYGNAAKTSIVQPVDPKSSLSKCTDAISIQQSAQSTVSREVLAIR